MTIQCSVGKLKREERQALLEEVYEQARVLARQAVKGFLEEVLELETTTKLGREKGQARRVSSQAHEMDWQCGYCGNGDANRVSRDGHYRRSLQTGWGSLETIAVPRL